MAGLGEKTPVSRLQEYLVSRKMIPHYDQIFNGGGAHNPRFTCRIQVGDMLEEATGRSKKEAKHRAAERMLKNFKIIDSTEDDSESESNLEPLENSVGQLKELCKIQCYPEPKYCLEESAGPAHCKTFRMICCVSQLQDHGVSSTKKQAKQEAARKMLKRLRELKSNTTDIFPPASAPVIEENKNVESKQSPTHAEITEKFNKLKPMTAATCTKDPRVFYKDHHKAFVGLQTTSSTLSRLLNHVTEVTGDNSLSLINDIARELEVTVTKSPLTTEENSHFIVAMSVYPPVAGLGSSEQSAAVNLLNSLMFLCKESITEIIT